MEKIDVKTLSAWLTDGKVVTILDVRPQEDRDQWSIPGSIHIDASEALKHGCEEVLDAIDLPFDQPIVTVCNRGKASQIAAKRLEAKGRQAFSLEGGMDAWSLAWNTAEVPTPFADVRLLQVRRTGKGCLSYLLGSQDSAAVIDASVEAGVYIRLAQEQGWKIRHVLDTHVHADHISRSNALAEVTGASLWMPAQHRVRLDFRPLRDGDSVQVGAVRLRALSTPGHTAESVCYLLDSAHVFTGDTLFVTSVGRPDLHADQPEAYERAHSLFHSLQRLRSLPKDFLVMPGHTGEPIPFDGIPVAAPIEGIFSRLSGWFASEATFVERILTHLPASPPNYQRIIQINEGDSAADLNITELEAGANRCAVG